MELIEEEKEAIKTLEEILKEYQKIIDIEDPIERECEMDCYMEQMPFYQIKILLKLVKKQQKEAKDYKKFKKDIVSKIMIWEKEELPDNERIIEMIDTLMSEVSRLEDIEDRKVEVAVDFIEEKRDKFWQDKIREKIKELEITRNSSVTDNGFAIMSVVISNFEELLEEK